MVERDEEKRQVQSATSHSLVPFLVSFFLFFFFLFLSGWFVSQTTTKWAGPNSINTFRVRPPWLCVCVCRPIFSLDYMCMSKKLLLYYSCVCILDVMAAAAESFPSPDFIEPIRKGLKTKITHSLFLHLLVRPIRGAAQCWASKQQQHLSNAVETESNTFFFTFFLKIFGLLQPSDTSKIYAEQGRVSIRFIFPFRKREKRNCLIE